MKCKVGWITSWNQDCQEKYQQPQICRWYHSNGRKWRGTKRASWWVEREEGKDGLKVNIQKTNCILSHHFMANGRGKSGISDRFYFLGLQSHWGHTHEIKRCLLLGIKTMTNLDSIDSRDSTLLTKVRIIKVMVFPIVMYRCESWTIKKTEYRRTDAFELWCWRTLLRVSRTATRSNKSILKEINPEYSLKGLMLKLKLWYSGHLMSELTHWERLKATGEGSSRG